MIFKKYKNIGHSDLEFIKDIDMPILIVGKNNVGKKSLVKYWYPNILICDDLTQIPDLANSISKVNLLIIICSNTNQKMVFTYIERYCAKIHFILVSNTKISSRLESLCFKYVLQSPCFIDIKKHIGIIMKQEGISYDIEKFQNKSYHDILVELTLIQNGKDPCSLYNDDKYEKITEELATLSHVQIRNSLYELFILRCNMNEAIKKFTKLLCCKYDFCSHYICQQAAKYEYNMCLGNKDIYHLEAFLFSIKNRILTNGKHGKSKRRTESQKN